MSQVTFLPQLALFRFQCELFLWCNKWKEEEVAPKSVEQGEGDEEQSSRDASPSQTESPSKPGVEGEQNLLANDSSHIDPTTRLTALQAVFEHTRTVQLPASICVTQPLLRNHHRYALDQLMFSTQSLVTTVLRYVPKKLFRVNALVNFFENHVQNLHVVELELLV
ncbi:hypothetical protein IWQ62_003212 [Dispira parvispora]|uniref:Uncharacterized protein n=1 Tax=Dispira parvispora TaxID=1520584 RepID=A0A9W8AV89_9FUNG|nr:hypothetical protein IWQ62_003212 [Dispira parvispora]